MIIIIIQSSITSVIMTIFPVMLSNIYLLGKIEGNIEGRTRRGKRRKLLLEDVKETII
jgi:hypothetical protein